MNRISLFYKFLIFFSAFTLVIIIFFVTHALDEVEDILTSQVRRGLASIAEGTEGQIFLFFENHKAKIIDWSSDKVIRDGFEAIIDEESGPEAIDPLIAYINVNKQSANPDVLITDIFDMNGIVRVSTSRERIGHTESEAEMNAEYALDRAKTARFGEAFVVPPTNETGEPGHMPDELLWHASTPLISQATGKTIGVMVNHIAGDAINSIVSGKWQLEKGALSGQKFILEQETAEMFLVNKQGLMITPSRFIQNSVFHQRVDNPATRACFDEKKEYNGNYIGYLGRDVQVASMCFVNYDMILLTEIATSEIFAPITKERKDFIFLGVALFFISIIFVFLVTRFILKGVNTIRNTANEVEKGNFAVRAAVVTRDEIGDLAHTFNRMLEAIEKSTMQLKDAELKLKDANVDLEKRVKDRTAELESLKTDLEKTVAERTVELQKKLDELEKFKKLTVGRELKMTELKQEIEQLKKSSGQ